MTTIIMNKSILSNEDLAQMAFEAVECNEMAGGLWAIHIDQYAMFDSSFMARTYKPGYHNAIVSVDIAPKPVAATHEEAKNFPEPDFHSDPGNFCMPSQLLDPENPQVSLDLARENGFPCL